jgi:hypothetical protein
MLSLDSRLRRKDQILNQRASETQILLNLDGGRYYALDEVGHRVWELCDGTRSVSQIIGTVCEEYDAPLETIEADVLELLQDLMNEKLLFEQR